MKNLVKRAKREVFSFSSAKILCKTERLFIVSPHYSRPLSRDSKFAEVHLILRWDTKNPQNQKETADEIG